MTMTVGEFKGDSTSPEVRRLFETECHTLARTGLHIDPEKYRQLWKDSLTSQHLKTLTLMDGSGISELVTLQHTPWDTDVLGRPSARLAYCIGNSTSHTEDLARLYGSVTDALSHQKIKYAVARVPAANWPRIHALEQSGFRLLDGIMTFCLPLKSLSANFDQALEPVRPGDVQEVAALAETTFTMSRFHNDELLSAQIAANVHKLWATNCCLKKVADEVFVARDAQGPVGFVTVRMQKAPLDLKFKKTAVIDLIAVAPRGSGKGLGKKLVLQACYWAKEHGAELMDVQTQTHNLAAQALYQKSGFTLKSQSFTFRWASS